MQLAWLQLTVTAPRLPARSSSNSGEFADKSSRSTNRSQLRVPNVSQSVKWLAAVTPVTGLADSTGIAQAGYRVLYKHLLIELTAVLA